MTFDQWARAFPDAAAALIGTLTPGSVCTTVGDDEAAVQSAVREKLARAGVYSWRNNVGATPAKTRHKCPACGFAFEQAQRPVRYGLANDSAKLNQRIKSSDLILAIPRQVTKDMVGTTVAQFGAIECKRPGWVFRGDQREAAQAAWLSLIKNIGGFAAFSTGDIEL